MKISHLQSPKYLTIFYSNLTSLKIGIVVSNSRNVLVLHHQKNDGIFAAHFKKSRFSQIRATISAIYKSPNSLMSTCLCTVARPFDHTKKSIY